MFLLKTNASNSNNRLKIEKASSTNFRVMQFNTITMKQNSCPGAAGSQVRALPLGSYCLMPPLCASSATFSALTLRSSFLFGGSLGWEDPLEEGMATDSSIPAWQIPWTEEPGGLMVHRVMESWTPLSD